MFPLPHHLPFAVSVSGWRAFCLNVGAIKRSNRSGLEGLAGARVTGAGVNIMKTKVASLAHRASKWAVGSLAVLLVAGAPAFAQHGGGGGGHGGGGGGGGHSMGGGGHGGGGFGGGHAGGFGGARASAFAGARGGGFGYGGAHAMGFAGGHAVVGGAGPHYAPRGGYSSFRGGYAGGHVGSVSVYHGGFAGRSGFVGRPAYGYGYGRGGFGYNRPYWGGGYWHGGYWPRCYYGWGYPWFLGALPAVYATYWWGGVPYYYANNVYYTWNDGSNGYVVTDPPPSEEDSGAASAPADGTYNSAEPGPSGASGASTGSAEVYAYPKSGQSDEQQSTDRYECHKWAVAQSGYDPTRGQASGNSVDYRRAMIACLDGRGYSTK